ncbi:phosphotransferase family protein [Rhodoblastus sp.]|uniref:phosphotransferase family protein n=1 Tax=Rhodoblastus sp. TaxID=1962975 RepID=UPI003F9C95BB
MTDLMGEIPPVSLPFDIDRLKDYLRPCLPGTGGDMRLSAISGGQSNPTYFVTFAEGGDFVLRKQPPGELLPSAHAIDREYRIQAALAATDVPTPKTLLFCDDRRVVGTPFYVMERLTGRVFHQSALPDCTPAERAAIYDSMNETLTRLHRADWQALGLADYGKPGNYFSRQVTRWVRQYQTSKTRDLPDIERLALWLPDNIPPGDETTIVHGDYRLGNLMFHPTEPRVIAVLDWELSTLGHPLADLGYNSMVWVSSPSEYDGILGLDLEALGIPSLDDYAAAYCRRTGRADGLRPFHVAFSLFRLALILEGIAARAAQGNAAAANAQEVGALSIAYAAQGCRVAGLH